MRVVGMFVCTICFIVTLIITMVLYGAVMLISIPLMIIALPFALIKTRIELAERKKKSNKDR